MRSHRIVTLHLLVSLSGFRHVGRHCCRRNLNGNRAFPENFFSCVRLSRVYAAAIIVRWVHRRVLLWLCAILRAHDAVLKVGWIVVQVGRARLRSGRCRADKAGHTRWWWSVVHSYTRDQPNATISQPSFTCKNLKNGETQTLIIHLILFDVFLFLTKLLRKNRTQGLMHGSIC